MKRTVGKKHHGGAAKASREASLGDALPPPILDLDWEAGRRFARIAKALHNHGAIRSASNEADLLRLLAAEGWDARWPTWMELLHKLESSAGRGTWTETTVRLSRDEWSLPRELGVGGARQSQRPTSGVSFPGLSFLRAVDHARGQSRDGEAPGDGCPEGRILVAAFAGVVGLRSTLHERSR